MNTKQVLTNGEALAQITPVEHWVAAFQPVLKRWPKAAGEQPTPQMLTAAVVIGKNKVCGREALHTAMSLRPEGVQLVQFILAGQPWGAKGHAHNRVVDYCQGRGRPPQGGLNWFDRAVGGAFRLTITPKGLKGLQKLLGNGEVQPAAPVTKAKAKPAKPAPKARKPKVTPVEAPPVTADLPQPNVPAGATDAQLIAGGHHTD